MGSRAALTSGVASSVVLAVIVAACAEGASEDPIATGNPDAATLEASPPGTRDSAVPEPEPDSGPGTKDSGPAISAACAAALTKASFGFDADEGWTHVDSDDAISQNASWPFDGWTRGPSTTLACPDGSCWGFERGQNYAQCSRAELISPRIDMTACAGESVTLQFSHAYAFWTGSFNGSTWFDGGIVEISKDDGATWEVPTSTYPGTVKILTSRSGFNCVSNPYHATNKSGFTGSQATSKTVDIDLPATALTANLRIRFSQAAGVSTEASQHARAGTAAGWRIDDVKLVVK